MDKLNLSYLSGLFLKAFILTLCSVRLESGNSIEEKLLKNGTKDLIREVAAQGMDYTLAFLTQVNTHVLPLTSCTPNLALLRSCDYCNLLH